MRQVVVLDAAEREPSEAVAWYEARRPGLGDQLIDETLRALQSAADGFNGIPYLGDENIRRVFLVRFPYSVLFAHTENRIEVLAFAHHRRRPGYWRRRS